MDKARLVEILSRERKKLEEGGVEWLREYGSSAQRDLGFTFYMICRVLAQSTESRMRSPDIQNHIMAYMTARKIETKKEWNPADFYEKKWNGPKQLATGNRTFAARLNSETDFDPEYTDIITRDIHHLTPRAMWLHKNYAADVRGFFASNDEGSTVHKGVHPVNEDSALTVLGRQLFWDPPGEMEKVAQLLRDKSQLIFYGPPGTGKTYVARALAKHLMGGEEPTFLQFHPSYSYEDFFESYRPVPSENGGMPQFKLVSGSLKQIAQKAASEPLKTFVLVIDEINRGNLAKIFGELYFLLEYRDHEIMLQYGGQPFSLPKKLLIIGTMNTADRSISHIDAALRRRFHFFPLFPDEKPIKGLLVRYLAKQHADKQLEWIARVVDLANKELGCRDSSIGHSHFMRDDLESWVERIWEYSIMPLIEDRLSTSKTR